MEETLCPGLVIQEMLLLTLESIPSKSSLKAISSTVVGRLEDGQPMCSQVVVIDGVFNIKFQIWRPTGGNSYVKIGENSFPRVQLIVGSGGEINEEVQSSSEQLHFQPGDVIGYYLDQNSLNNIGGIQFDDSFTQEELWYTTGNSDLQNECRLDIGTGGDLSLTTTLGPIISVTYASKLIIVNHLPNCSSLTLGGQGGSQYVL